MASWLVAFHRGERADSEGRMLEEYWEFDDETMERQHDFIQWMFPLAEPSAFNADAPLVTRADRDAFGREPGLRENARRSLVRFLGFVGLEMKGDGTVGKGANFDGRISVWRRANHNWLRVTRVMKSLRLMGLEEEAGAVWLCLQQLHEKEGFISEESFGYWEEAAGE